MILRSLILCLFLGIFSASVCLGQNNEGVLDSGEVQQTVKDILSDPEYRHLFREKATARETEELPDIMKEFLEWLFGEDDEAGAPTEARQPSLNLGQWLLYSAIVILVAILLIIAVNLFRRMSFNQQDDEFLLGEDQEAITPTSPPGDIPSNEYEQRALLVAGRGDFRSALRELVLGAMSWTERAALIRYRRGLTNRDYVRALWSDLPRRESLQEIILEFERVFYGRRPATKEAFEKCLIEFRQSFAKEDGNAHLAN